MEDASRTSSSNAEESIAQSDRDENDDPTPSESEPHFQPICGTNSRIVARSVSQVSSRSSRSISRVYSLSDGYSHPAVDNDRLQEPEDDEKAEEVSTAPGAEYTVKWDGHDDPDNPRNMKLARKWAAIAVLAVGSVCVTCASSLYTMTYAQLMEEFNCSRVVATLGLSFFILGLGLGPLVLAPLSEFYGRRIIYVTSFAFFLIWLIPCAVAQNIETMLVARFFTGISGSAFLSVAGGTIGDMFARHELGAPMMIYTASPFLGPELGPLLGGFICEFTSWRWIFYMLLIWSASVLVAIALFVPETYHPVLLRRKAIRLRRETGDERWRAPIERRERSVAQTVLRTVYRPMMLLALEPMCLSLCIFSAILLGIIYLFFGAFQLVFSTLHGFTLSQVGLSFLGLFVGMMVAILSDPLWRRNYTRLARKREMKVGKLGEYEPEWRLPPAIAGAPLVSIGIFIFAWTVYRHVHWIAPIIGTAVFGMGTVLVYSGIFTFLVDAYPLYAASALAANSFLRSSFGAVFPLFGIQMYHRLGFNWASSLLAFLTVAMAPFPFLFFRYGKWIRKGSRFANSSLG
ncbi:MFS multidrug transporter [Histoplasma capsulatum G186AR]|uniref:MFS multidrug transporter n=1 Tax=Ajellomyces capsulatus TaxID=5037 RepID=A0A8H8D7P0_AJECA|nr:MFS multidrug transporter [Histoplasma capsulatum]QSS71851.1 MFS multidrug transporter [Histoplasma capsulatum G186AR]